MLVLMRMLNEDILIGNDVVVTVVEIRGSKVRLGIQAPKGIPVDRREIRERKLRDGEYADGTDDTRQSAP